MRFLIGNFRGYMPLVLAAAFLVSGRSFGFEGIKPETASAASSVREGTPEEYILGPGDELSITVPDSEQRVNSTIVIDPSGYIGVTMIGRVKAAGLTIAELHESLSKSFKTYFVNPQVAVNVVQFRSQPVSVIGAVNTPGVHQLQGRKTLVEVLSLAGGARQDAGSKITITRERRWGPIPLANSRLDGAGKYYVAEVNLDDVISGKRPEQNILIQPRDVVSMPRAELVYVIGEVRKPGGFTLHTDEKMSVLQALSLSEGMLKTAAGGSAKVLRASGDGGKRTELPVNVGKILAGKTEDIAMMADDILFIPNSAAKSVLLRTLETGLQIGTGVVIWRR